ncbi:MAG: bifunctional shikimate kinase/3-dehydroquinate synthase [Actinomycetota bacterium]|nr:bifunctional shikimate kinase/3-dehydroquinate synthase [Actinomycetota bacterium]
MARGSLVLIGFMGAGKSSALDDVLDTDRLLEDQLEMSIATFFAAYGERRFRQREEPVVLRALRSGAPAVALGGGAVLSQSVRAALAEHTVVWMDVSLETAWERAAGEDRPLAADREAFAALYHERRPLYESIADAFIPEGDRLVRRAQPALDALREAPPGTKLVYAATAGGDYPVYVGRGLLGGLPRPGRRAFLVTDEHVIQYYGPRVRDVHHTIAIEPGEEHKTIAGAERVWRELAAQGMGRDDHLVALGGGVVGDLAGFCAATYQRGVPVVQVPTTVVAQVDSAYGGKTGVDLPEAKNYVGVYHQPAAVITDVDTLATLAPEEHAAGYAEVLKTALIAGGSLWERVADGADVDERVVLDCARTKLAVVAADERDAGARQMLNLGHTVGHAIETVTGYARYRHGEAIALGLLAALRLSGCDELRAQVSELLARRGLPTRLENAAPADVVAATKLDKKRRGDEVPFVLVRAPGDVRFGQHVASEEVLAAVAELAAG